MPVLCNFVTMSAIVSARTLDDEAVSVTNFEATLNKRSSLRVEPNRAHQRSDWRWAAPRPAAKITRPVADTALYQKRLARTAPDRKHNPPKRANNQIDRAGVLEVRIHLPPAANPLTLGPSPQQGAIRSPARR